MLNQFDLFAPAPTPPPPAAPRDTTALTLGHLSQASLDAMCVTLLRELPGDRVILGPVGWDNAMRQRAFLAEQQIAGTLTPGDRHALTTLNRLQLAWAGETTNGAVIVPAYAYTDLQTAIATLRCAAQEHQDG